MRTAVAALSLFALVGCSAVEASGDSSELVCDEFAGGYAAGMPADERVELVRSIGEVIDVAAEPLREWHEALVRTAAGPEGAYKMAADGFAQACFDNGWEG